MTLFRPLPDDNAPRFQEAKAHVESWFWRFNHPSKRRAVWIKATVLKQVSGETTADVWCTHFDGAKVTGRRATIPLNRARFSTDAAPLEIEIAGARFSVDRGRGTLSGVLGELEWDLSFHRTDGALAESLCFLPSRRLLAGPLPKFKVVTPLPSLVVSGTLRCGEQRWKLASWVGSQGHNWGPEHSAEYAWCQCLFPGTDGPAVLVEGTSAKLRIAGRLTPWLSALVVRRGAKEWRFDRLVDTWNHDVAIDDMSWVLRIRGEGGEAVIKASADPAEMACLGYRNPNGFLSYCMNSKLSKVWLRVNPRDDDAFECFSAHGGALEFLRDTPDPRLGGVI